MRISVLLVSIHKIILTQLASSTAFRGKYKIVEFAPNSCLILDDLGQQYFGATVNKINKRLRACDAANG